MTRRPDILVEIAGIDPAARQRLDRERDVERTAPLALDHRHPPARLQADPLGHLLEREAKFGAKAGDGEGRGGGVHAALFHILKRSVK